MPRFGSYSIVHTQKENDYWESQLKALTCSFCMAVMLILYNDIIIIYTQLLTTNLTRSLCSRRQNECWSRFVTSFGSCRYHIAGTKGVFYSREPYVNDSAAHVTRFIGLANVGNKEKQVFIYRSNQLLVQKRKKNLFVHVYTTFLSSIVICTLLYPVTSDLDMGMVPRMQFWRLFFL